MSKSSPEKHSKVPVYWSTILLGVIVAAVFLMAIFWLIRRGVER